MDSRDQRGLRLAAEVAADASPECLLALAFDPERYVAIEPRVRSIRWIRETQPAVGAQLDIEAEIPYSFALARSLFGTPHGTATIQEWSPPDRVTLNFSARLFRGSMTVALAPRDSGSMLRFDGRAQPRGRIAQLALRPLERLLEQRARASIERAVARADAALR